MDFDHLTQDLFYNLRLYPILNYRGPQLTLEFRSYRIFQRKSELTYCT